jgi:hypothetical protein
MHSRSSALRLQVESALAQRVPAALTVRERPAPEVFPTGLAALDALTGMGGLPRSALTEICGPASSGRTSVLLALLAQAASRQESCALIDASDAFHPESAQAAGVDLGRLLWVRCGSEREKKHLPRRTQRNTKVEEEDEESLVTNREPARTNYLERGPRFRKKNLDRLEQALKATDLLLQSGGFGLLVVDLADIAPEVARRVPLTSWFRFRRAVEETSTALVVLEQEPFARTCASLVVQLRHKQAKWSGLMASEFYAPAEHNCAVPPAHTRLLGGLESEVEVTRSRVAMRKPNDAEKPEFTTRTAWAG